MKDGVVDQLGDQQFCGVELALIELGGKTLSEKLPGSATCCRLPCKVEINRRAHF